MKGLLNSNIQQNICPKLYSEFSKRCLNNTIEATNIKLAKADFLKVRDVFIKQKQIEDLCDRTLNLSQELKNNGNSQLSDILINEIGKLCLSFNRKSKAEELLLMAVDNSRAKNDGLHELARLTDLEYLYKNSNERKKLFEILNQKKACCKRIIANYDENAANFNSIFRKPTTKRGVQVQLAITYSTLGQMLERRRPENAIKLYSKSFDIYKDLEYTKESNYLATRIKRLENKYRFFACNTH